MVKERRRILLADDDEISRRLLESMLQRLNYEVDVVADGCELLKVTAATHYDLIIMDIKKPPLGGICISHFIRLNEQPLGRRTPIMAVTACSWEEYQEFHIAGGIDAYLLKPLELKQLLMVIENLVMRGPALAEMPEPDTPAVKTAAMAPDASGRMWRKTGIC